MGTGGTRTWRRIMLALVVVGLVAAGCAQDDVRLERAGSPVEAEAASAGDGVEPSELTPTTPPPETTLQPTIAPPDTAPVGMSSDTVSPATVPPPPPPPTTEAPTPRTVVETGFTPFATVEHLVLLHPAALVERIGFHEAGHDGTRHLEATAAATRPVVLETRNRGTGPQTAADIVVPPDAEIRAPVTGTVKRAGSYVLYCDNTDDYAVIEPDDRPGWEVKVLHITGVQVQAGQRVEAGTTVLALGPTILPFASQVDDHTARPAWPHVHVEVLDPSIPDKPNPGGGSNC